jgi:hypothetical protein
MPPRNADPATPNLEDTLAQLAVAVLGLVGSQAQFMRSAADADLNIGLSISTPLLLSEELDAQEIDNTVDDSHRNGIPAASRDYRPSMPSDYVFDLGDTDYDHLDPRHGTAWGLGHHDATSDRADQLSTWHRARGRNIRNLERQLPADGYMNTSSSPADQQLQWKAHP